MTSEFKNVISGFWEGTSRVNCKFQDPIEQEVVKPGRIETETEMETEMEMQTHSQCRSRSLY